MKSIFLLSLVLLIQIFCNDAETVDCSSTNPCGCSVSGEPCIIVCDGEDACKDTTLTCTSGQTCEVTCNGKAACSGSDDAIINGNGATNVTVVCSGEDTCKASTIDCGTGECTITCEGEKACEDADIDGTGASSFNCTGCELAEEIRTDPPTTAAPTLPTTAVPTTAVPTTAIPTTAAPTPPTPAPTTAAPTPPTPAPTTAAPTTAIPTTAVPTTAAPTTAAPTPPTPAPTTAAPTAASDDGPGDDADSVDAASADAANALFQNHAVDELEGKRTDGGSDVPQNIVLSLSKDTMINVWGLVIGFVIVNGVMVWCFCLRGRKEKRATFKESHPSV